MHTTVYKIDKQQHPVVYSTGYFTQYSIVNHDGKESDKLYMCVCVCVCVCVSNGVPLLYTWNEHNIAN